jgi:epoxide hydrolase 4
MNAVCHHFAEVNGQRLHYAEAGDGPLIVFLHGLPRCWYLWRYQLADLAADHRAVAPDLRGYNLSSKPEHDLDYGVWPSVEDIRALVDYLGYDDFVLVGHDVGGRVAWSFALHYPERLQALVVMSAPHPALLDRELRENPSYQEVAAKFMITLRDPQGPELVGRDDFAFFRPTLDNPFLSDRDREVYLESWRKPGAAAGMLGMNRREGISPPTDDAPGHGNYAREMLSLRVAVPTLVLHGTRDAFDPASSLDGLETYVPDLTLRHIESTHWIPEEVPDEVNALVRQFIGERPSAARDEPA